MSLHAQLEEKDSIIDLLKYNIRRHQAGAEKREAVGNATGKE